MKTDDHLIKEELTFLYGTETAEAYLPKVLEKVSRLRTSQKSTSGRKRLSEKDSILITYGDNIRKRHASHSLVTLHHFLCTYVGNSISTVHILPFFPYTSDDGFSIVDYKEVDPKVGNWQDVESLGQDYKLMFDLVANHCSRSSRWFKEYLACRRPYSNYFITCDPEADYCKVFRPRLQPLLTPVDTTEGKKYVWTTFSSDQIDLNYANPDLLMEILDVLCFYAIKGASIIRLDAIAFIWKQAGTRCLHQPQVYSIIRLMRKMLEMGKMDVKIITETNVPHKENISYFGNGSDEATMVYNFPLPPLTLYTFMRQDTTILTNWAATLETPGPDTAFFNFLASHDGIGLMSARGIIPKEEIVLMADRVQEQGGHVSFKDNGNGTKSGYELNINFFDALNIAGKIPEDAEICRFLASQAIILSLKGVPGIYIHSLLGNRNDTEGVQSTGCYRSINREKLDYDSLTQKLQDGSSINAKVLKGYRKMLDIRKEEPCFSPYAGQQVLKDIDKRVFALERSINGRTICCLINVSSTEVQIGYKGKRNLLGSVFQGVLAPYQVAWLEV
ncbi:MAG: sugar phosphorylase [Spirochaetia bacterium]|nr:sugar phosphorylase [Spirochaetia bacterium]